MSLACIKFLQIIVVFPPQTFTWGESQTPGEGVTLNPIRPGLFSRLPGPGGGLRGPDAKNQGYQPIKMKFGMSHYGHKSIPDAKFESDSSSSFGDMTSQNFPRKKGTSHEIRLFTPGKRV